MQHTWKLLIATIALACGGRLDDGERDPRACRDDVFVPGQEGRIDGCVWQDGMFNSPEAKEEFCASPDGLDAWFCSDMGTAEQAWTSDEYHGRYGTDGACYDPQSVDDVTDCLFPSQKHFRLIRDESACHASGGPTNTQELNELSGLRTGMMRWHNIGALVVDDGTTGSDGYNPVTWKCAALGGSIVGLTNDGPTTTVITDMLTGFGGKDMDDANVYSSNTVFFDIAKFWGSIQSSCGTNPTQAQIRFGSEGLGAHEMGHVLGFGHFGSGVGNIMFPFVPINCSADPVIAPAFTKALNDYDPAPPPAPLGLKQGSLGQFTP